MDTRATDKATRHNKRSRLQQRAAMAIVEHGTVAAAADAIGVSRVTLQKWTRRADFADLLKIAAGDVYGGATARLRGLASKAVDTLAASLDADKATPTQLRAAALVLEHANRAELDAVLERLERLERAGADGDADGAFA